METQNKNPVTEICKPVFIIEKYGCILNVDMISSYSDVYDKSKPGIFYTEKVAGNKHAFTVDLYNVKQTLFFNRDLSAISISFCSLENKVPRFYELRLSVPADISAMSWLKFVKPKTGETVDYFRITGISTQSKCVLLE